jgi:hypothetical protein
MCLSPNGGAEPSEDEFCEKALKWSDDSFGRENVVWAGAHRDEKTFHVHTFVVPVCEAVPPGRPPKGKPKKKKTIISWNRFSGSWTRNTKKPTDNLVMREWQTSWAKVWEAYGYRRGLPSRRPNRTPQWIRGRTAAIELLADQAVADFEAGRRFTDSEFAGLSDDATRAAAIRSYEERQARNFAAHTAPLQELSKRGIQLEDERQARCDLGDRYERLLADLAQSRGDQAARELALNESLKKNQELEGKVANLEMALAAHTPEAAALDYLQGMDSDQLDQLVAETKEARRSLGLNGVSGEWRVARPPLRAPQLGPESTVEPDRSGPNKSL